MEIGGIILVVANEYVNSQDWLMQKLPLSIPLSSRKVEFSEY